MVIKVIGKILKVPTALLVAPFSKPLKKTTPPFRTFRTFLLPSLQSPPPSNFSTWNLLLRTPSGLAVLSFVKRLSSFRGDFL